jgi:hypothetical protein
MTSFATCALAFQSSALSSSTGSHASLCRFGKEAMDKLDEVNKEACMKYVACSKPVPLLYCASPTA